MMDSQNLLAEYRRTGSDAAFRELVTQYVDLVYSTALRLVNGDAHRAQDVSQTVFVDLARMARTLANEVLLGGWLHRHTCFVAVNLMRGERRRQSRERQAAEMNALQNHSEADYSLVAPLLDEAINELGEEDRAAILLRFFEQHDFRAVGLALGSNEDAARMRVNRALEKLEESLKRHGVTTTAASLGVVLTANAVQAAPVGLAVTISTAAALTGTTLATTTTATAIKAIAMTTLQKTVITATLAIVAGVGIYEARQASQLREQNLTLQQQQAPLIDQINQSKSQSKEAANRLSALADEIERLKGNSGELLRLRSEVARLRRESQELAQAGSLAATTDEAESAEKSLLDRVKLLKQRLERFPSEKNPEFQFLTEFDWLQAARRKLETDGDYRGAFSLLRQDGEHHFLQMAETALRKYLATNSQVFPTEMSQLTPFFDAPPPDEILQRYHVVPKDSIPEATISGPSGGWIITLKSPDTEALYMLGTNGVSGTHHDESNSMGILAPAMKAALEAAPEINGRKGIDLPELAPYLTTPEQKAAFQRLMKSYKPPTP